MAITWLLELGREIWEMSEPDAPGNADAREGDVDVLVFGVGIVPVALSKWPGQPQNGIWGKYWGFP